MKVTILILIIGLTGLCFMGCDDGGAPVFESNIPRVCTSYALDCGSAVMLAGYKVKFIYGQTGPTVWHVQPIGYISIEGDVSEWMYVTLVGEGVYLSRGPEFEFYDGTTREWTFLQFAGYVKYWAEEAYREKEGVI